MKLRFFNPEHSRTKYVQLFTKKCKACWKCIDDCPNQVINKIDLPWHKHVLIVAPYKCNGCIKCVKVCQYGAYSKIDEATQEKEKQRRKIFNVFIINNLLIIFSVVMVLSGLILQLGFHAGGPKDHNVDRAHLQSMHYEQIRGIDTSKIVCGFNYADWSLIHKLTIVIFSLLMIYHIYIHLRWYKVILTKHLIRKNIQVIILSISFLLVAITGYVPWCIDLSGSTSVIRFLFIEIHDKLALILAIYLFLHIVKRNQWFITTYAKLKG